MKRVILLGFILLLSLNGYGNLKDSVFVVNSNGTVTDTANKLMWVQSVDDTRRNWNDAKLYCENLIFAGFSDWRMPTQDEMVTLQRAGGPDYAFGLARKGFKKVKASYCWTSTEFKGDAILVSLLDYAVIGYDKNSLFYVIPVRSIE